MWLASAIPLSTVHSNSLLYFLLFWETQDLVWEIISVSEKRMKNYIVKIIDNVFEKWRRWFISFKRKETTHNYFWPPSQCLEKCAVGKYLINFGSKTWWIVGSNLSQLWLKWVESEFSLQKNPVRLQKSQFRKVKFQNSVRQLKKLFGPELSQKRIIVWVASHFSVLFPHESKLSFYFSDFLNSRRRNIPRLIQTVGIITKQGQIGSWGHPLLLTLSGLLRFTEAAPPAGSPGSAPARCDRAGGETGGDWPGWPGPCGPVHLWCHIWRSSRHRVFSSFMPPTSTGAAVPRVLIGLPCVHVTEASVADAEF